MTNNNFSIKDDELMKVNGGSDSNCVVSQKDQIINFLKKKCLWDASRSFEANLRSCLAIAFSTSQKNISVVVSNNIVSLLYGDTIYQFEEIMNKLYSYYGSL